jgi:hypothetical protein
VVDEELGALSEESASEACPPSVSNRYSLSIRTHGSSCRCRASSSQRRGNAFSALSSSIRAASHPSRVPILCAVIGSSSFSKVLFRSFPFPIYPC